MSEEKRYEATCCVCGNEFFANKSIMQHSGINEAGHGRCPECETFLNLTFDPEQEIMLTKKWDDFLAERRANSGR
ncbi:hypothetical protein [Orenia marismortui]|uniref:hypothetical protein n=1 Tax=Orenia marismortui TaxID=46469 RepID=UPI00036FFF79|nr:hypothetical protein [Orenia marismortui]